MSGGQVTAMFSTPDIAPTLIEAAGLQVPASMTGASILPVIRDARAPWRDDSFFQVSESETGRAIRTKRWKYGVTADYDHDRPGAPSYREVYLYDLDADPYEMVNLAGMAAFRETADMLKARLLDWIARIEGETPEITDATAGWAARPEIATSSSGTPRASANACRSDPTSFRGINCPT